MICQSMSGDADSGTSAFTMTGGILTSLSGHMFHVTNTLAVISLSGVRLVNEGSDILLSVCDDGWSGASNIAEQNADAQALAGTVLVGSNSSLTLTPADGSSFEGTFSGEIINAKGTQVSAEIGTVTVSLDETSTWTLSRLPPGRPRRKAPLQAQAKKTKPSSLILPPLFLWICLPV